MPPLLWSLGSSLPDPWPLTFTPDLAELRSCHVLSTSNSFFVARKFSRATINRLIFSREKLQRGILRAPEGPKWHFTEKFNLLKWAFKPSWGSKTKMVLQNSKNGNEMRNGACLLSSFSKTAGRSKLPCLPSAEGIDATWCVTDFPWTERNRCSCLISDTGISGGICWTSFLRVSLPTAIRWHPASIVAQAASGIRLALSDWLASLSPNKTSGFLLTFPKIVILILGYGFGLVRIKIWIHWHVDVLALLAADCSHWHLSQDLLQDKGLAPASRRK